MFKGNVITTKNSSYFRAIFNLRGGWDVVGTIILFNI